MSRPRSILADSQLLSVHGYRVRIRIEGQGDPLLLLNGATRAMDSWGPFTQAMSGRTIVRFDAPGVGGSPTPMLPLSIPMLAGLAASLLDAVRLCPADVLGFSHGGAVAQQFAVQAPGRVRRLVLVSTSCGVGATPGDHVPLRSARRQSDGDSWARPDALGALWQGLAIASWSSIPFLGAIRAPTLVVCGSRDRVVPAANSRLLARRIPGSQLMILPGGHDLQRRGQAHALAGAVEPFLAAGHHLHDQDREVHDHA
jgi:pimeloyl-ACP methyl ester carboxylesterase